MGQPQRACAWAGLSACSPAQLPSGTQAKWPTPCPFAPPGSFLCSPRPPSSISSPRKQRQVRHPGSEPDATSSASTHTEAPRSRAHGPLHVAFGCRLPAATPPSEFEFVQTHKCRSWPYPRAASRPQWPAPCERPGGPLPEPYGARNGKALAWRYPDPRIVLCHWPWSPGPAAARSKGAGFGWDRSHLGRTAQSGEDLPIMKAGPNRESQAGRERSAPLKPTLR